MKTKLIIGLSLVFVCVLAFALHLWFGKTASARKELAETVKRSEDVFRQYEKAEYDTAKQYMLEHIHLLDQSGSKSANPILNPYAVDAMLWHVRLAKLEERSDKGGMSLCFQEAIARCEKLGWSDCSEEYLRHQVDRMDTIAFAKESKE